MNPDCSSAKGGQVSLAPDDAARLVANICEIALLRLPTVPCAVMELTRIFEMGVDVYEDTTHSELLEVAIEQFINEKQELRFASYRDYKTVLRRLLRMSPAIGKRLVRSIRPKDCVEMIAQAYAASPGSLDKARRLLHCFFTYALRQNWCVDNPVRRLRIYRRQEMVVAVLNLEEIARLLETVARSEHRACAAAVGLMLWAGMRPTEVTRLRWAHVDWEDRVVRVVPRVSKTGGARLVSIEPVLLHWLKRFCPADGADACVAPANWARRWQSLRQDADLNPWRADALRHTFASYHLRHFSDIHRLQLEMGHSSARLLFSRYLNLTHITREAAAAFWNSKCIPRSGRAAARK